MLVIVEKQVFCKPDLDVMFRSYSILRIWKVLLFSLVFDDRKELQRYSVNPCAFTFVFYMAIFTCLFMNSLVSFLLSASENCELKNF